MSFVPKAFCGRAPVVLAFGRQSSETVGHHSLSCISVRQVVLKTDMCCSPLPMGKIGEIRSCSRRSIARPSNHWASRSATWSEGCVAGLGALHRHGSRTRTPQSLQVPQEQRPHRMQIHKMLCRQQRKQGRLDRQVQLDAEAVVRPVLLRLMEGMRWR